MTMNGNLFNNLRFKLFIFSLWIVGLIVALILVFLLISSHRIVVRALDEDGKIFVQDIPDYSLEESPRFLVDTIGFLREKNHITQEKILTNSFGSIEASIVDQQGGDSGIRPQIESSLTDSR